MCITCSLTVSRSICHASPPPRHACPLPCTPAPCCTSPYHACPLPSMPPCHAHPPATHTPTMHVPLPHMPPHYNACPMPCTPPAMHTPPAMYTPCHTCPPTMHVPPTTMHAPLPRTLPLWTEWQTGVKILPCPKLRLQAVNITQILQQFFSARYSSLFLRHMKSLWDIMQRQYFYLDLFYIIFLHLVNTDGISLETNVISSVMK